MGASGGGSLADADARLARQLLESGRLTREQLAACLAEQRARGGPQAVRLATIFTERRVLGPVAGPSPGAPAAEPPPVVRAAMADPSRRIGRYVLVDEIGRGAMGVVQRAWDPSGSRFVAIKTILDPARAGELQIRRFRTEAAAASRLKHPTIVETFEVGEHEGKPFLVMHLVQGESLETLLRRAPLPAVWIAQLLRGVALALEHAHKNGVVHRDVKPENVIVDREGQPRLTDFGVARDASSGGQNQTATGAVIGTPAYMAPEMAGELSEQGPRSDVYGLGAVLYRALAGRPPFEGATMAALMKQVLFETPKPPRELRPEASPTLSELALRCLEKEPAKRPPSAQVVADELERFLREGDRPADAPDEEAPEPDDEEARDEPLVKRRKRGLSSSSSGRHEATSGARRRRSGRNTVQLDVAAERERQGTRRVIVFIVVAAGLAFLVLAVLARG